MNDKAFEFVTAGVIYLAGRDIKLRPTIIIDFKKLMKYDVIFFLAL